MADGQAGGHFSASCWSLGRDRRDSALCQDLCGNKPFLCLCHACSVDAVPCSRRCRDLAGSLPRRCGGQWPVRAGQARGHPEASAVPNRAVGECVNAPGSSAPTLGGIMRLSYPSGP